MGKISVSVLLFMAITGFPISAIDNLTEIDISGLYGTTHPKESWGVVLVQFSPSSSVLFYKGAEYAAYDVSLWKKKEDSVRKLRDGIFGTYTLATAISDRQGRAVLWYSPDERRFKYNKIISVGTDRSISIGSQDLTDDDGMEYYILKYTGEALFPNVNLSEGPTLEGIYDYYHSSTGRVLVGFRKSTCSIRIAKGEEIGAYSVTVLSQIPGVGYAVVREGLYGGSLANDSYPLVGLHAINGEHWLVWSNPARPGQFRKNRIVASYENGDIGIGLDKGEAKYIENTVFKKISGLDVKIGRYCDFVTLEGLYSITLNGSASQVLAVISPTNLVSDTGDEKIPIFKIRSVEMDSGRINVLHDGLSPGDPFYHLGLSSAAGRCILVWYSFALQVKEQHILYDLDNCGNFKLGKLRKSHRVGDGIADGTEERRMVAEFRKIVELPGQE
jgi:hypothetical protein